MYYIIYNTIKRISCNIYGKIMNTTIKKTFLVLMTMNIILFAALVVFYSLFVGTTNNIRDSYLSRYNSYLLADELRQSSDDLTRLGRTYVITGDKKYEKQYFDILDIRNGKKPRPSAYQRIYWDFYTVNMQKPRPDSETTSLETLMKNARFTDQEFELLKQAQQNSDGLVSLEVEAMNAVKGIFADTQGNYNIKKEPDFVHARKLVHSEDYHKYKANIMSPLDEFYVVLDKRTQAAVAASESNSYVFQNLFFISIIASVLCFISTIVILYKRVINPVDELTIVMTELAGNNLEINIPGTQKSDEIGKMATSLQSFKETAIREKNVAEQQKLEHEEKQLRNDTVHKLIEGFKQQSSIVVSTVAAAATELSQTSHRMNSSIQNSATVSEVAASEAVQALDRINTIAAAAQQMSTTVNEISSQVQKSHDLISTSVNTVELADKHARDLSDSSSKVQEVVQLISDISGQINLLALNATIESARAGEAGKGFAVVASEVKNLAVQTDKSIQEIDKVISDMDNASTNIVSSLEDIKAAVSNISDTSAGVSAAIEEQHITTRDIAANITHAAQNTQVITDNIQDAVQHSQQSKESSEQVLTASQELSQQAEQLDQDVKSFLLGIKSS